MRTLLIKNVNYFVIFLSLLTICIGLSSRNCEWIEANPQQTYITYITFFKKVFLQNIDFGCVILVGCLFFNISTFCVVLYNGFIWGSYFKVNACHTSINKTIIAFLPHSIIELVWITILANVSMKLSFSFYDFMNDRINSQVFLNSILVNMQRISFAFILIIISVLVETLSYYFN